MTRARGFHAQPSTYAIGVAPTERARCRCCARRIEKGAVRIEIRAFVRPGRRTLLFRCAECPKAFCEDCLPDDAQIITDNPHFAPLGYVRQKSACFVTCSEACAARQNEGLRGSS